MNRNKLIHFLRKNATITFEALPESTPVRGNALCSGDPAEDKTQEDEIISELDNGNIAAWFCAKVTARFQTMTGTDYLGCCSYESLEQFTSEKNGYYEQMVTNALGYLADNILVLNRALDSAIIDVTKKINEN